MNVNWFAPAIALVALQLAGGNPLPDISGELTEVRARRARDLEGKNVKGMLVLSFGATASALLNKIRDVLSGEFKPLPMSDVMAELRAREASGAIWLVPKAPGAETRGRA